MFLWDRLREHLSSSSIRVVGNFIHNLISSYLINHNQHKIENLDYFFFFFIFILQVEQTTDNLYHTLLIIIIDLKATNKFQSNIDPWFGLLVTKTQIAGRIILFACVMIWSFVHHIVPGVYILYSTILLVL